MFKSRLYNQSTNMILSNIVELNTGLKKLI